jgi:hypothetical protein
MYASICEGLSDCFLLHDFMDYKDRVVPITTIFYLVVSITRGTLIYRHILSPHHDLLIIFLAISDLFGCQVEL